MPPGSALAFPPRCAARYRQERIIGSGAHGAVFRAVHRELERPVAIKLLHPDIAGDAEQLERFRIEARSTASIHHPNVLVVLDFDLDDALPWIAYELLDGPTLHEVIAQQGPLPWSHALLALAHIAGALEAAHTLGVLHRDVKPSNVIQVSPELYKLTDFGLARLTARLDELTQEGCVVGTPAYLAPEVIEGLGHTTLTDIFAAGGTLYKLVTGQVPPRPDLQFSEDAAPAPGLPAPSEAMPGLPAAVDEIVARCTRRAPGERYQSATELRRAVERARGHGAEPTPRRGARSRGVAGPRAPHRPAPTGRRVLAVALLAAALAVLAWYLRPAPPAVTAPAPAPSAAAAPASAVAPPPPLPDATAFRQLTDRMRRRWHRQSELTQLMNPLAPNLAEAARVAAERGREARTDVGALARIADTLASGGEPAALPDHVLHWLVRASAAHFWAWAQHQIYEGLERRARENLEAGTDIPGRHELLHGMDDLEYGHEGVALLRRYLSAALELFVRIARTPERAGPDTMEVLFEEREIARMLGHCRWPKGDGEAVARATLEFKARLARLPGPAGEVIGRLLTRFWDWGDPRSRVRMTRASYTESLAEMNALGALMPGASASLSAMVELMRREMDAAPAGARDAGYTPGDAQGAESKR